MLSDSDAQRNRPAPFAIEIAPTSPAAVAAVTPVISSAIGAACEMIAMPAVVFRNSSAHRPYHCQLASASCSVYTLVERCFCCAADGVQPLGTNPAGGFFMNSPAQVTAAR